MCGEVWVTEFIITCQSELQKDGSYKIERYKELIRCKDCQYYTEQPDSHGDRCARIHWSRGDDWFCSDGEKREGMVK